MKMLRTIGFLTIAGLLAGCGSPTDAVTFKPPAGFTSSVSVGPFMQMWTGPQKNDVMLMALPTKIDLNKAIQSSSVKDAQIVKKQSVMICGDQPALYAQMIGSSAGAGSPSPGDKKEQIDFIATVVNAKTYMAMYLRPLGAPLDQAAEDAIHAVCPK